MKFITKRSKSILATAALTGAIAAAATGPAGAAEAVPVSSACGTIEVAIVHQPEDTSELIQSFGAVPTPTITVLDAATTNLFIENFGSVPIGGEPGSCDRVEEPLTAQDFLKAFGAAPDER